MKKSELKEIIKARVKGIMEIGKEVNITTTDGTSNTATSDQKKRAQQASKDKDTVVYKKPGVLEGSKNFQLKSNLEKIINQAWKEQDLIKAKQIIIDFLKDSGIKEEDKKKMISTINSQPNKQKLDYYLANALLKFEGHSLTTPKKEQ